MADRSYGEDTRRTSSGRRKSEKRTDADKELLAGLVSTIEGEIIPRLMLAHRVKSNEKQLVTSETQEVTNEQVVEFAWLSLSDDENACARYVEQLRDKGVHPDQILIDLMAPAARRLGDMWVEDICTFTEVTIGLTRLHTVMHELTSGLDRKAPQPVHGRRILLCPAPEEQHTFGLIMVSDFMRRTGWDVWVEPSVGRKGVAGLLRDDWFDLVGLSASSDAAVERVAEEIATIRRHSRNRSVGVMVGGRTFNERPALVTRVGADGTAPEGRLVAAQAKEVLELVTKPD